METPFTTARHLLEANRLSDAANEVLPLLEKHPSDPELWYLWAMIQIKRGDVQWGVESLRKYFALRD